MKSAKGKENMGKTEQQGVVATTPSTSAVVATAALNQSWGKSTFDPKDVLIPKLLLMQPISELVADGKVSAGSVIKSTSEEVVGGKDEPVKIIPLSIFKTWVVMEKIGNKFEYRRTEPYTSQNANRQWEWTENGASWQANMSINLYALLPQDIAREQKALAALEKTGELPDPDDALLPVVVSFTRTSFKTGKEVATHFAKAESFNTPAAGTTLGLTTEFVKGEKGSYYIFNLTKVGRTPLVELQAAKRWYDIVTSAQALKVDDSDLKAASDDGVPPPQGEF